MPIIKSAIKKMRQDRKRTKVNRAKKDNLKLLLKKAKDQPTEKNLGVAFSALDKAAKIGLIAKGKADRKKSRLAKKTVVKETKVTKTKAKKAKTG